MEKLDRPVPAPRRTVGHSSAHPSDNCSSAFTQLNTTAVPNRPKNGTTAEPPKPKPKPRNLIKRLGSATEKRKFKKSDKDAPLSLENENYNEEELTDDAKRGTINLFKVRRNSDPFDIEFEKSLTDAELLSNVTFNSPLEDLPPESRASLAYSIVSSSNSNSTDDYYVEPPSSKSSSIPASKPASLTSTSFPPNQNANTPFNLCGETNNSYMDTEGSESIYEPISSYSSSSSTSGSAMNEFFSLPVSANNNGPYRALAKRSTVPMVGVNGHATELKANSLALASKSRYQRFQDEQSDSRASSVAGLNDNAPKQEPESEGTILGRNPSNASDKRKLDSHEYDDVAIENGNVVFLDNLVNTVSKPIESSSNNTNSNSSIASRNSVVMEFDPLFENPITPKRIEVVGVDSQRDPPPPPHHYEFANGEDRQDGNKIQESRLLALTPMSLSNSDYFHLSEAQSQNNKIDSKAGNSEEELEPIAPIADLPTNSKFRKSQSPKKGGKDDSKEQESGETGKEVAVAATSSQGSFLRRLSNKIRLGPIREEVSKSLPSNSIPVGPVVTSCNKCFDQHPEGTKCKFTPVPQPDVVYSSNLYKPSGIKKEFTKRFVFLSHGKLSFQNEKTVVTDEVPLEKIGVMYRKDDAKAVVSQQELYCFALCFVNGKPGNMTLGAGTEAERCLWMQKYIETFSSGFPTTVISSYDRGGWCFIKDGLTSNWVPSWFVLKERVLFYSPAKSDKYLEMDLRKARAISLTSKDGDHMCPFVDNSDVLTIDMSYKIFYVQTESGKLTSSWAKAIQEAARKNGPNFEQMQLTLDNVPVIVDKCIDFLYAHGTLAEGIYRHSGSNSRITQLLADFQKDAWAVQLSPKEYSAHDVAGTLKRFFRTLPEPVVTAKLYEDWIQASGIQDTSRKMETYDRLLEDVPLINYNILKKLICHLYAVHELHEKNLMPLINLAPIWGPTLMNVDNSKLAESAPSYKVACAECEVVKDLIENYYTLFHIDSQERDKERKMQDALENFHLGSTKRKCSGDMKMYIYILDRDDSTAINITLTPTSTANTVVQQLCRLAQIRNNDNLFLYEVICEGALKRPLHPSEKVIETVLRWSIWDIEERKNNYLILQRNTLYPELLPHAKDPKAVYGDMKFADSKSKTFKKYAFTFSNAYFKYSKDSKATAELGSWKIEDMVWYLGVEQKRTPPTKWSFTFVKRNYPFKRSKEEPFFGNVISFNSQDDLNIWIAAMVVAEHPAGLYPSVLV